MILWVISYLLVICCYILKPLLVQIKITTRNKLATLLAQCNIKVIDTVTPSSSSLPLSSTVTPPNYIPLYIHNPSWYVDVALSPSVAFGDGYSNGSWSTTNLYTLLTALLSNTTVRNSSYSWFYYIKQLLSPIYNYQSLLRSKSNVSAHYDIGNDLYSTMLDKYMQYSCAWWPEHIQTLEDAQLLKIRVTLTKLQLKPGMKLLDIGCGWGGLLHYAQREFQVTGVGLTLSKEQVRMGTQLFPTVNFVLEDYRTYAQAHQHEFDRIVSVGMFEHVGVNNYATFFNHAKSLLKDKTGIFLLHTISSTNQDSSRNEWIEKRIFPGGELPTLSQISKSCQHRFVIEDVQNVGCYYARTLNAWRDRCVIYFNKLNASKDPLTEKYHDKFQRAWLFYLTSCQVAFEQRHIGLLQLVLTPDGYRTYTNDVMVYNRVDGSTVSI